MSWADQYKPPTAEAGEGGFPPFVSVHAIGEELDVEFLQEPRSPDIDEKGQQKPLPKGRTTPRFWVNVKALGFRGAPKTARRERDGTKTIGVVAVGETYTLDISPTTLGRSIKDLFQLWGKTPAESKLKGRRCTVYRIPREGSLQPFFGVKAFQGVAPQAVSVDPKWVDAVAAFYDATYGTVKLLPFDNLKNVLERQFKGVQVTPEVLEEVAKQVVAKRGKGKVEGKILFYE